MATFVKLDENNIVVDGVSVPDEQEHRGEQYLNEIGLTGRWMQTSYNSYGNVHYNLDGSPSGKKAFRKNYAGIGFYYDETLDAFIPPKPIDRPSYILNLESGLWQPPISPPESIEGGQWFWAEVEQEWFFVADPEQPEMI